MWNINVAMDCYSFISPLFNRQIFDPGNVLILGLPYTEFFLLTHWIVYRILKYLVIGYRLPLPDPGKQGPGTALVILIIFPEGIKQPFFFRGNDQQSESNHTSQGITKYDPIPKNQADRE